jgi:hypothetical protein
MSRQPIRDNSTIPMSKFSAPAHYGATHLQEQEALGPYLTTLPKTYPAHERIASNGVKYKYTNNRLPCLDPVSLNLHRALHAFRNVDDKYALDTKPYEQAFNWDEIATQMHPDDEREWYIVAFRSWRRPDRPGARKSAVLFAKRCLLNASSALYHADREAHEEAVQAGGLIMYWYGEPNEETGNNLATCIWTSNDQARAARTGPKHIEAMKLASKSFDRWQIEQYVLRKVKGGGLQISKYESGRVGWVANGQCP